MTKEKESKDRMIYDLLRRNDRRGVQLCSGSFEADDEPLWSASEKGGTVINARQNGGGNQSPESVLSPESPNLITCVNRKNFLLSVVKKTVLEVFCWWC